MGMRSDKTKVDAGLAGVTMCCPRISFRGPGDLVAARCRVPSEANFGGGSDVELQIAPRRADERRRRGSESRSRSFRGSRVIFGVHGFDCEYAARRRRAARLGTQVTFFPGGIRSVFGRAQ